MGVPNNYLLGDIQDGESLNLKKSQIVNLRDPKSVVPSLHFTMVVIGDVVIYRKSLLK